MDWWICNIRLDIYWKKDVFQGLMTEVSLRKITDRRIKLTCITTSSGVITEPILHSQPCGLPDAPRSTFQGQVSPKQANKPHVIYSSSNLQANNMHRRANACENVLQSWNLAKQLLHKVSKYWYRFYGGIRHSSNAVQLFFWLYNSWYSARNC